MAKTNAAQVKQSVDITEIIGQYVQLKPSGPGEWKGSCPFHDEKTPSFTVTAETQMFYCFGCQAGGDVIKFLMKFNNCSFAAAIKELGGDDPVRKNSTFFLQENKPKPQQEINIVDTYPYVDEEGKLLYEVCRLDPKDFRQRRPVDGGYSWDMKGVRRVLYRLPMVLASDLCVIVEGERDVHTLEACGFVATTNSGGANQKWLPEWTAALLGKRVIILPDNDEPGKKRALTIYKELAGKAKALIVIIPDGKDITEYFEKGHTVPEFNALMDDAERESRRDELENRGLLEPEEILSLAVGGTTVFLDPSLRPKGLQTGFTKLDDMTLGMQPGEMWILAARPGAGKTAMAMNIAVNIAEDNKPVGIFSLEMSRESLLTRMVCCRSRIDSIQFRLGGLRADKYRPDRERLQRSLYELCQMPLFIDDRVSLTLKVMQDKLLKLRDRKGLSLVVVDYLQLMSSGGFRENRNQEVGALSRGLKIMAREFKVPFLVLSQLNRDSERRTDRRPQLSDLRDGGGIEQDADLVAFIYREELYKQDRPELKGLADLLIAKQRNGPIGKIPLIFIAEYTRFENRSSQTVVE